MIDLTELKIGERLGQGSQGKVFLAADPRGGRYTVKLVMLAENADRQAIFERAAQFREGLLDRSMVPILSYGMVSATPTELARQLGKLSRDALVVVMPHVAGTSLADLMAASPLSLRETVAVLSGIAAALAKLPDGVVHGDLRAPNIFLRSTGEVLLMDPDLTQRPPDGDDLQALGGMLLVLLNASGSPPTTDAKAIPYLRTLAEDVAGHGMPHGTHMEAHEALHRLEIIAGSIGSGREPSTALLLKRLKAFDERATAHPAQKRQLTGDDWDAPLGWPSSLGEWWEDHRSLGRALLGLGLAVLAGMAIAVATHRPHAAQSRATPPLERKAAPKPGQLPNQ